ncbi:MAG TPA: TonB family protein [Allosphingosinicella sp.]|jgi:TonB family protein|nr:TonB family protein [Allosphingosinicella sp.]
MSALALAMILTGAGDVALDDAQRRRQPVSPPPVIVVRPSPPPLMPPPYYAPAPAPPPPPRFSLPRRARANLNYYFSTDDYPAAALRGNEQGTTGFRLTIGTNGRVTACMVTLSSGSAALDQATCRILRSRARYIPARDSYGNPVEGSDSGRVTWRLPADEGPADLRAGIPVPFAPAAARAPFASYVAARDYPAAALRAGDEGASYLRIVVGITGRVVACDINETSGSDALDAAACRIARARARYTPARGQAGAFVCDVLFEEIEWLLPPRRRAGRGRASAAMIPPPIEAQLTPGICPGRRP